MAGSTISSTITISVTLGNASYPSPLTITSGGFIDPDAGGFYGATGLVATIAAGTALNQGTIVGAAGTTGASGYTAGIGAYLANGSLTNTGIIVGGTGGYNTLYLEGDDGGAGVVVVSGSLTNGGTISGGSNGTAFENPASAGNGVDLTNSSLTNTTDGVIQGGNGFGYGEGYGGSGGVGVDASSSVLINNGDIIGGAQGSGFTAVRPGVAGVSLTGGSTLINRGVIAGGLGEPGYSYGGTGGVGVDGVNSSMTNAATGVIFGGGGGYADGSFLPADGGSGGTAVVVTGGTVVNSGVIEGAGGVTVNRGGGGQGGAGVSLAGGATLTNIGTILGGNGGTFEYDGGGLYASGGAGVEAANSSLTNMGLISGGNYAPGVALTNGILTNAADAVIAGNYGISISGGGTVVNAGTIGLISGQGSNPSTMAVLFTGTGTDLLVDDPGAVFVGNVAAQGTLATLELASEAGAGAITGIGSSFTGFGAITVDPLATWTVSGSVTGNGTFSLGAGSDLVINGGVTATSPVHFTAATGTLGLGDPAGFAATVYGFQPGDAFDFTSITDTGSITAGVNGSNELTLTSNGTLLTEIKLDPTQNFSGVTFQATPDSATGTLVTEEAPLCFLAGTLIATPGGEVPIEQLRVGDVVLTARGEARPVVWIGAGRVLATRGRRSAATPVIVRKGALADNVPHHDLRVTRAHALCVDGALIPAEFLVNHRSILWDDRAQEVALYHVELAMHDVLLANGAPAESYRDDGNRWLFRNANSGRGLAAQRPCAPVLTGGPVVDAAWLRLLKRAGPRPGVPLTDDPDLHLVVGSGRVDAASRIGGFHVFGLGTAADGAHIASRVAAPQELGLARDPRRLGVAVQRIVIRQGSRSRTIKAEDAGLAVGFHAFEPENGWRWTDGDAHLPAALFTGFDGPLEVVLLCGSAARYVADGVARRAA